MAENLLPVTRAGTKPRSVAASCRRRALPARISRKRATLRCASIPGSSSHHNVFLADGEPDNQEVGPERRNISVVGIAALRSWHMPPGVRSDGTVDADVLRAWTVEALRLLTESGHTLAGGRALGRVLADIPPESDGLWPATPVQDLIEELDSDTIDLGLSYGKIDARLMASWSLESGGASHRALASQFRAWDASPTSGALRRCSGSWQPATRIWAAGRMTDPRSSRIKAPDPSFRTRRLSTSQCQPLASSWHTCRNGATHGASLRACSEGTVMSNAQ